MKALTPDELMRVPDWMRELIESLDDPQPPPCVPPYRPFFPREATLIRAAIKKGWLRAEDYPGLLDAKERMA